ncbi:hypothetical protein EDO6_03240 [Paenibacillus xylanexedens]|nr:hypothetical protein EDO6_03240 [Paenibacillus xylanexedens]
MKPEMASVIATRLLVNNYTSRTVNQNQGQYEHGCISR